MNRKPSLSNRSSKKEDRLSGRTGESGLVNGRSSRVRANGLVNGNGLINGGALTATAGKVNGRGLVNGLGYTNGHTELPLKKNRFGVIFQRDVKMGLSLVVFFLLILPAVVVILETEEYIPPIRIDSKFEDWAEIRKFSDAKVVYNDNINIWRYSTVYDRNHVFFYVEVVAKVFDDAEGVDAFYIFVDEDRSPSSGYRVRDIGADFMIEVFGGGREVLGSKFSVFGGTELNWSAWETVGSPSVGLSESMMEVSVFSMEIDTDYDALIYSTDFEGNECFTSVKFGPRLTSLVITQSGVSELLGTGSESFLRLDFTALGGDLIVEKLNITRAGNISIEPINFLPLSIEAGRTFTEYIRVDTSSVAFQDFVELELVSATARHPDGEEIQATIRGQPARAYIGGRPSGKRIDGFFYDWTNRSFDGIDDDLMNKNVDITEYSTDKDDSFAYFYMKTKGAMLGGAAVPQVRLRGAPQVAPPSGVVRIPRKVTGEDITRIYLDTNSSDLFGFYFSGVRYDYMIEIRGIYGEVLPQSSFLYKWDGETFSEWATVEVRKNTYQMECSTTLASLGPLNESRILFVTTDWSGEGDTIGEPTDWTTRGGTRSIYLVEETSSSSSNTAFSSQRKLFYDGTYYWSFYYNGTLGNISYEYSSDGTTWTNAPEYFPIEDAQYASIWYNSSNSGVYAVADNDTTSKNVSVVNGTISGNTISWDSPVTVEVSGLDENYKVAYVTVNSSGYVWIAATTKNATSGYNINVTYTDNPEDISQWGTPEIMRSSDVSNEFIYPIVLPLSDTDMYVIWYADGYLEGRKCQSGSWQTVDSIDTTTSGSSNKGPSAVIRSGNIHMVYVNSSGYVNYSKYTGSWSKYNLNSTDTGRSPTITLDTSSSYLYVLWINSSNQIVGNYSTDGGSSWSQMTGITTNTDAKGNLTSIYSCNLNYIAWEFDSSTQIKFEPIPEFTDLIVPIASIILFILIRRRRDYGTEAKEEA
ncbi:MAG: hypothetical protein ACE5QW_06260 [Thermoplasmata archaeon]